MATRSKPKPRTPARGLARAPIGSRADARIPLPRVSKGKRPQFYDHAAVDHLMAIVTALTGEVSVAFDRIDTLERVLVQAGTVAVDDIESFVPSEQAAAARGLKRAELIQRVFAVFEAYGAPQAR